MSRRLSVSLVCLSFIVGVSACSGENAGPAEDLSSWDVAEDSGFTDVVGADLDGNLDTASKDSWTGDVVPDAVDDLAEEVFLPDSETSPDVDDEVTTEFACGQQPQLAQCEVEGPAPSGAAGMAQFSNENAIALRCNDNGNETWDFGVFGRAFQGKQVFFLGETHGSVEIGQASAALFEFLVREMGVNVLVMEIGMDTTAGLNEYLATGDSGPGTTIAADMWDQYSENMFRKALPEKARMLVEEGYEITVVGVDTPQRLSWVNEQLEEIADEWSDVEAKELLLDTMPGPRSYDSYGMFGIETAYVDECEAYYDNFVANIDTICQELSEEDCTKVEMLVYGLWMGAIFLSQDFMMAGQTGQGQQEMMEAMALREVLLKYNFAAAIPDDNTIVYAHMGSAHTAKTGWSVSSHLDLEYEVTAGDVYSVTSAYGPGSKIFYGIMEQSVPAEPSAMADGLKELPMDKYFVSANSPGFDCTGNPFLGQLQFELNVVYGEAWDAFFWHRVLTPDTPEGWWMSRRIAPSFALDQMERMEMAGRFLEEFQRIHP